MVQSKSMYLPAASSGLILLAICWSTLGTTSTVIASSLVPEQQVHHVIIPVKAEAADCAQYESGNISTKWIAAGTADGYKQYVYSSGDIVSTHILNSGRWETHEVMELNWALEQAAALATQRSSAGKQIQIRLIDVGANIGYITLLFANKGYPVIAFEAMDENARVLQASMCLNPSMAKNIILLHQALGSKRTTCYIASGDINVGDGFSLCAETEKAALAQLQPGYGIRGSMSIDRLDTVFSKMQHSGLVHLRHTAFVLKVDTEGHEFEVARGAAKLLAEGVVWYIMAEYAPNMMNGSSGMDGVDRFPHLMYGYGYEISKQGFRGPFISPQEVVSSTQHLDIINLYMSLKELYRKPV